MRMIGKATYSTIRDPKQAEKHVLIPSRRDFRHHGLSIGVVRRLEQAEEDIIDPEISDMVVSHSLRPETQHSIKWYENAECIGHHEHIFRFNPEVLLEVPEPKGGKDGASRLGETEIGDFEEREGYDVVLDDRDECPSGVESICEKEK